MGSSHAAPPGPRFSAASSLPGRGCWLFRVYLAAISPERWPRLAKAGAAGTVHVGRVARLSQRQGLISAPMAEPPTVAGLRRAGIINSQEIVAAIDVYLRDPAAGPYRFTEALIDRVLEAQILGRPVPAEQSTALIKAAFFLRDQNLPWWPMLARALHGLGRDTDEAASEESAKAEALQDADLEGLSRFFARFRKAKYSSDRDG